MVATNGQCETVVRIYRHSYVSHNILKDCDNHRPIVECMYI